MIAVDIPRRRIYVSSELDAREGAFVYSRLKELYFYNRAMLMGVPNMPFKAIGGRPCCDHAYHTDGEEIRTTVYIQARDGWLIQSRHVVNQQGE